MVLSGYDREILRALKKHLDGFHERGIEEKTGIDHHSVSRHLEKLEREGLVTRNLFKVYTKTNSPDKRKKVILWKITRRGEKILDLMSEPIENEHFGRFIIRDQQDWKIFLNRAHRSYKQIENQFDAETIYAGTYSEKRFY